MKIKDIISELQRFNGDDYLVLCAESGDIHEIREIVPHNTERRSNVAIKFEGNNYKEEMVALETENGRLQKNVDRAKEILEECA